jgi:hypothetical protein
MQLLRKIGFYFCQLNAALYDFWKYNTDPTRLDDHGTATYQICGGKHVERLCLRARELGFCMLEYEYFR